MGVNGRSGTSQSLERGLSILSSFSAGRQQIGISELSRELGLTRSTTHRYVATLARLAASCACSEVAAACALRIEIRCGWSSTSAMRSPVFTGCPSATCSRLTCPET